MNIERASDKNIRGVHTNVTPRSTNTYDVVKNGISVGNIKKGQRREVDTENVVSINNT